MINEIKVIKGDSLPSQTMIVSPDLYDLLTLSAEKLAEKNESEMCEFSNVVGRFKSQFNRGCS